MGGDVDAGRPAEAMPFDMRKAQLPASFPIEIPVPLGRIVDVVEQDEGGTGVWTYELESGSSVSALADWYQRSYASANWLVAERTQTDSSQITLAFAKGEAQSVIQIRTAEGGSIVQASVGLGIPVAETY